jgi:transcriptional regulator with XRE-family HTH domain
MSEYTEAVVQRIKARVEASGESLTKLAQKMGYDADHGRKSVSQFLKTTTDPRLSMIEKFAIALGCTVAELLE